MAININFLSRAYFYFDKPVDYNLGDKILKIYPVSLEDSEIFLASMDILTVDKNSIPSVEIIQMSYLQFILNVLLAQNPLNTQKMINILTICLKFKNFGIKDYKGKPCIYDKDLDCTITSKQFDDIKRIILYQNLLHYDDSYINPDAKKAMDEIDLLKNQDYENISLERRIAIITAHCGLAKKEQLAMTFRSHSLLFEEVCSEVDFETVRPISLYACMQSKKNQEIEHWIYRKKKNKFNKYFVSDKDYNKNMGGDGNIAITKKA